MFPLPLFYVPSKRWLRIYDEAVHIKMRVCITHTERWSGTFTVAECILLNYLKILLNNNYYKRPALDTFNVISSFYRSNQRYYLIINKPV